MRSLKYFLASMFPRKITLYIKYIYHIIYRVLHNIKVLETNCNIDIRKKGNCHTFFGYYDISPFNSISDEIIYLRLPKYLNEAQIILASLNSTVENVIAKTSAWNWQQGSRLRWMPNNSREIVFNDYVDKKYVARIINIDNRNERIIDAPLYDISPDGKWGLSIDFERLQNKRPGYGYNCGQYVENNESLSEEGIDLVDIANNTYKRIITYKEIVQLNGCESNELNSNYINHLSFSPSGEKFLFFWLTAKEGAHLANLLVFDIKNKNTIVLESHKQVSHYAWEDDDHIICTAYNDERSCNYFRYTISDKKREVIMPEVLSEDGHPSLINNHTILTDTYPDLQGFQKLYLVDISTGKVKNIVKVYSDCRIEGEKRTDLHPRLNLNHSMICYDSNQYRFRCLNILKLNDESV